VVKYISLHFSQQTILAELYISSIILSQQILRDQIPSYSRTLVKLPHMGRGSGDSTWSLNHEHTKTVHPVEEIQTLALCSYAELMCLPCHLLPSIMKLIKNYGATCYEDTEHV